MDDNIDENAKRVRSLLSSYYGPTDVKSEEDNQGSWKDGSPSRSPMRVDINSKGFDAESHVSSLIAKARLEDLLHQDVAWAAEIKNLDSDMQMLVYENYNKFISATDTIRRMKDNIASMESSMEQLLSTVTAVQMSSDSVNASLFQRRKVIEQLNGTRSLLRKVQFIFDLPKRIQKAAKAGDYAEAVQAYLGASPILESYGDTSFKSCRDETEEVMAATIKELQGVVMADDASPKSRSQASQLLLELGQPVDDLMDEFLEAHWGLLLGEVHDAATPTSPSLPAAPGEPAAPLPPSSFTEALNENFVEEFASSAETFCQIFPSGRSRLVTATKELFNEYLRSCREMFHQSDREPSASLLVAAIVRVSADVTKMHELVPEAHLPDQAADAVEAAVSEYVVRAFANLESLILGPLSALAKQGPTRKTPPGAGGADKFPLKAAAESAQDSLLKAPLKLLQDLHRLLDNRVQLLATWHEVLIQLVQSELQSLFTTLSSSFLSLGCLPPTSALPPGSGPGSSAVPLPGLILLLARLCVFAEQKAIPRITEALALGFAGRGTGQMDEPPPFIPGEICRNFRSAGNRLLQQYVDFQAQKLSLLVRKSIATPNWLKLKEPRDVRMVADLLLEEVDAMEDEVQQLLEPGAERSLAYRNGTLGTSVRSVPPREDRSHEKGVGRGVHRARSQLLERDVAKLFTQKVELFTKLEFTRSWVVPSVIKLCLKGLMECVRLKTYSRNGFQQLQLDTSYLRSPLASYMDDETVVETLLDEVCSAAAERCLDPVSMELSLLEHIISAKRLKMAP